jgi:RNA polymerase sigma-70 factor (ECF subfamily)
LNRKRAEGRRLRPAPLPEDLGLVEDPHASEPQLALEAGELYGAIAELPDDFRDVLVAVDVTGLSYKEAARALRIREGTVMSRLYRARQQVIRRIEGGPRMTRRGVDQPPRSAVPTSTFWPEEA